jgi:Zn-finger nucleic acid-binding protein
MSERHGIEIDYCPQCRGVWLDRGELDKIIDRVAVGMPPAVPPVAAPPQAGGWVQPASQPWAPPPGAHHGNPYRRDDSRHDDDRDDDYRRGQFGKPRKNWLSELFD